MTAHLLSWTLGLENLWNKAVWIALDGPVFESKSSREAASGLVCDFKTLWEAAADDDLKPELRASATSDDKTDLKTWRAVAAAHNLKSILRRSAASLDKIDSKTCPEAASHDVLKSELSWSAASVHDLKSKTWAVSKVITRFSMNYDAGSHLRLNSQACSAALD